MVKLSLLVIKPAQRKAVHMETRTYTVYSFKELPKETQEKVIQQWYEKEDYPFLSDDLEEELRQLDTLKLFSNVKLQYSLGYCQGDGLSFSGDIDLEGYLKHKKLSRKKINRYTDAVYNPKSTGNTGNYCYASKNNIYFDLQLDLTEQEDIELEAIRNEIAEYYMDICEKLEKTGYAIMEYRMSIEEFEEMAESNGYMFTANGKID
jgi:hypothetical protein